MPQKTIVDYLTQHVESLIFTAEQPISVAEIQSTLEDAFGRKFQEPDLNQIVTDFRAGNNDETSAFEV
ncbi:MAG: SMC-Scp complex subunit ScpB, partial [Saprospiraceae bacterium]|nr:SMC-Scp complex subunit ScpB [Saprospiraceae bacterium]